MTYTHRERIEACLRGEKPDQTPVAFWRHFPVDDQTPESLAAATLHFQQTCDFDLVKVTPSSSFCLKDWGVQDTWEGSTEGTRRYTRRAISKPQDWEKLPTLDALTAPHLSGQLACLRLLRAKITPDTPLLQTIFNPLAQARNLAGADLLTAHIRLYPEAVMKGLETIAESTRRFIEAAIATGIDGIFYAIQHAQAGALTKEEFTALSSLHDQTLLAAASSLWCNMAHLHGNDVYFDLIQTYPIHILNWHDRDTPPPLADGQKHFNGTLCGGLSRETLALGTPQQIEAEVQDAIQQTGGQRLIIGTGCVVPIIAPHGNLQHAIAAARRSHVA